ncbi:MAG: Trk family potassium uptake protein, partial [Clostridia bacterium]|nr:Trk family potassium uptake protein [Clostridia bacterium]
TATSALSVTGLTVVDTGTHWNSFGQVIIMLLMEIGGLGIMFLTTMLWSLLGLKINMGNQVLLMQEQNYFSFSGVVKLVKNAVILTASIEFIGIVLIFLTLPPIRSEGIGSGLFWSLFHGISAFTGAGFSLCSNSLESFAAYPCFNLVIVLLISLGSLGFLVLSELAQHKKPLTLHTKLVLVVTLSLTLVGTLSFWLLENQNSLAGQSLPNQLINSLFQGVTRTAGFTNIPIGEWSVAFVFLMILLMFIGASPGSVGGGLKTTTFAIILLTILSLLRGHKYVVIFQRELDQSLIFRAFLIAIIMLIIICSSTFLLLLVEKQDFLASLFEVTSALSTVGLSLGITSQLSFFGKILLGILMFIGKIGLLSLLLFTMGSKTRGWRYMKEDVLIG